ncbi:MAG TPA: HEAT repeat domain-containing protein [Vicinamibacteria bacterium]|nr:HEAT repeat domain-containing protein [Vicinamibacteria bacterium]
MRRLLGNLSLSLAVTAVVLVLLEGGARLRESRQAPPPPVADYIWDWDDKMPGGFYVMKSEAVGWPPWEEFNGDGLRDRTRSHEKPDLVRRVAVLGDSVAMGAELRPEQSFPRLLEARAQAAGRPVEVMNVALWGWSTRQERIAWQRIARRYRPDAVVLAVCLNDIPELFNNLSRPPQWLLALFQRSAAVRLLVDAQGREIDSVERLFSEPDAPRVQQGMAAFFEEVRALRREVEQDGASFAVVVFPFRFQVQPGAPPPVVQRRIAAFCAGERLRCLDLLPVLLPHGSAAFVDYDHLSPRGGLATAEALEAAGLLPPMPAARELLAPALAAARDPGWAVASDWLAAEERPLAADGARALAALLKKGPPPLRWAAAWALERAGKGSATVGDALALALRGDSSTAVRAQAAAALGASKSPAARAPLFDALAEPSEAVRHEAARGLEALGTTVEDVPRLQAAVDSPDEYVSAFAAWSLGNLGAAAQGAVPVLAGALARPRMDAVVTAAIARIGPAAAGAVPVLVEALRSPDTGRRWRAARALGRIGPAAQAAVPALEAALADPEGGVRQHAARALGRVGLAARPAAAALQRATGDPDPGVRREARLALDRLH